MRDIRICYPPMPLWHIYEYELMAIEIQEDAVKAIKRKVHKLSFCK